MLILSPLGKDENENWDGFIHKSLNGTIHHEKRFISYHGNRFSEYEKFLQIKDGDCVIAQISGLIQNDVFLSPYGSSFGGFVFNEIQTKEQYDKILNLFLEYLNELGVKKVIFREPYSLFLQDFNDYHASLAQAGFKETVQDLAQGYDFKGMSPDQFINSRTRNHIKQATDHHLNYHPQIKAHIFYDVLLENFKKFDAKPTHSLDELIFLKELYPNKIRFSGVFDQEECVASMALFQVNESMIQAFYMMQKPHAKKNSALSFLIFEELKRCKMYYRYFDYGTSSYLGKIREGLYKFKEQFSNITYYRKSLEWMAK